MSYRTKVQGREDAPDESKDPAKDPMNCPQCNRLTTRGALSNYGARCFRCFEGYCREPFRQGDPSQAARRIRAEMHRRPAGE